MTLHRRLCLLKYLKVGGTALPDFQAFRGRRRRTAWSLMNVAMRDHGRFVPCCRCACLPFPSRKVVAVADVSVGVGYGIPGGITRE